MIAFLTSSPFVCNAPRAILNNENEFLDNLRRCLPGTPRCLFVCSSPDDPGANDRFGGDVKEAFLDADIPFRSFTVLDRRNQDQAQLLLWQSDLVVLAGGHVPTQNRFFQEIRLGKLLENYQGVVLGISAGTMNAAGVVYAQPEAPGESRPEFQRWMPGLGLTRIQVLPHYQQAKDYMLDGRRLYEDVTFADSMGQCFFAFVDGTYILIEDGLETINGIAYCIRDGSLEQISGLGEIVVVQS